MKKISLLIISILTVLAGCSSKEESDSNSEVNKTVEDNKKDEKTNYNDDNNINNSNKISEVKQKEEQSKIVKTEEMQVSKVKLNITPQVQKVWNYCAPTTVSMMLSTKGVSVDQYTLAREMGTYEPFGTHNKDAVRILNKHMFGYEYPAANQAGYRLETVTGVTADEVAIFKQRLKKNIDDGYPVYLTMDVSKIYSGLKGEHNVVAMGYILSSDGKNIDYVYYLDPAPKVQDSVYGGLKIEKPEVILNSMLTCEEPNYAW